MKSRHLKAKGKGVYDYDYKNDILYFKIKDREYLKSIEFENLVVDIDKEGFITGLRIFDASKIFNIQKIALNDVRQFEFNTSVENNIIKIQLRFIPIVRNKPLIKQSQNLIREVIGPHIKDSEVVCTV